jgi:lysophospholipase L1-like esterase
MVGLAVVLTATMFSSRLVCGQDVVASYQADAAAKWEKDIAALDSRNASEPLPQSGTLFIGSSSIRLWKTLPQDLPQFEPIERGFGGATFSDLAVFAPRIIKPHRYRALVIFVANDVTGGEKDKSPEEIEKLVRYIVGVSREHQPDSPVVIIEITPTPSRFAVWNKIRRVNAVLREIALTEPNTYFVATAEHYLTPDNQPRPELFQSDRLHLNADGYAQWTQLIGQRLGELIGATSTSQ